LASCPADSEPVDPVQLTVLADAALNRAQPMLNLLMDL
jgi:hypothetical protein